MALLAVTLSRENSAYCTHYKTSVCVSIWSFAFIRLPRLAKYLLPKLAQPRRLRAGLNEASVVDFLDDMNYWQLLVFGSPIRSHSFEWTWAISARGVLSVSRSRFSPDRAKGLQGNCVAFSCCAILDAQNCSIG